MSRCFPFPPPGYEKKIRTDEANSLIKEKQKKEKKHKKDKNYKVKKEGKEKKDKDTSNYKHKEGKEKKEKPDRKDKDRDKRKSRTSEDKKSADVLPNPRNTEELVTNSLQNNGNGDSKFIEDLARRIRDEEATDSHSVGKISFPCGVAGSKISCPIPQTNHKKDDEKKFNNTHRISAMEKGSENAVLRVSSCTDQKGVEVMVKPVERKNQAKKTELQEKNYRKESVTKSDKPLDRERIKKSEPMYTTQRISQEKKEEKTEAINKAGQEKPKFVEGGHRLKDREHDYVDNMNLRMPELSRASVKKLTTERDIGKRKDLETNGLLHENGCRPNKIQRPIASSAENGRKLGACQTPPKPVPDSQVIVCNPVVKEHRINGLIDSQEPKSHPPASSVKVKENGEASAKKRPHPDSKYLDQILNVPKSQELHGVDENEEQEWLFGQSGVKLPKKPKIDSTTSLDETPQVWNQARRIEYADTVALPYVVPF